MNNNMIRIMAQGFYGNRTLTDVHKDNVDRFILGYLEDSLAVTEEIDRTIVNVPNTDNVVIVYNKYEEENELNRKEELLRDKNYDLKPLVVIPEENIVLYSRCIVCRMNEHGELESLQVSDLEKFVEYLAE